MPAHAQQKRDRHIIASEASFLVLQCTDFLYNIIYISRTSCRKCSKCFYVYLNIRPMRYSARIESVSNARRSTDCRSVTEGKRRPSSTSYNRLQQRDAYASFSVERRHARIESVTNARRQRIAALSLEERDAPSSTT